MNSQIPQIDINPIDSHSPQASAEPKIDVPQSVASEGKVRKIVIRARLIDDASSDEDA